MNFKKTLLLKCIMFSALLGGQMLFAGSACECGDHDSGITMWTVEGRDCCNDNPGPVGTNVTYAPDSNGMYMIMDINPMTGNEAQNNCCRPT